jgi:hypothetical protein
VGGVVGAAVVAEEPPPQPASTMVNPAMVSSRNTGILKSNPVESDYLESNRTNPTTSIQPQGSNHKGWMRPFKERCALRGLQLLVCLMPYNAFACPWDMYLR